jgi:hypothetical protein
MAKAASEETSLPPEVLAKYEPVIGLEVHVQLLTNTKIFCGCSTRFGDPPNSNVLPGVFGTARFAAGAEQARGGDGHARFAGAELHRCTSIRVSRARIISIPICRRAIRFRSTNCRWRPAAGWRSSMRARASASASRACTLKKTRPRICTKVSRNPPQGLHRLQPRGHSAERNCF